MSVENGDRRIIAANSSYADFAPLGGAKLAQSLLSAATERGGAPVDIVAIDMPISRTMITGRREADNAVSRAFGRYGAGTHSPSEARPGVFGRDLVLEFVQVGFSIATKPSPAQTSPALIEVFPLAALVRLMHSARRPPYKVAKARKYWPGVTPNESIDLLLDQWQAIAEELTREVQILMIEFPKRENVSTRASLKRYEDMLDAVICAWAGACYLEGRAESFGDENAAIWVPVE
ncbi:MAG TPA: DUF429 domain-containing protein, partial [Candidatus Baltobacteraceae bacterium]|nr:DUF429 domain-containing protein [Candidatus Baltobacteraceae bacterium]